MFRCRVPESRLGKKTIILALSWLLGGGVPGQGPNAGAESLRDPTRPLDHSPRRVAAERLQLHSILIGEKRKAAVINGEYLREQDTYNGVKIIRILPGKVIVRQNGSERALLLHQTVRK